MHWRFYFFTNVLLLAFGLFSLIFIFANQNYITPPYSPPNLLITIPLYIFSIITLTGLYVFVFKKKFLTSIFWRIIFIIQIILAIYNNISSIVTFQHYSLNGPLQQTIVISSLAVGLLWQLPLYYALCRLGFPKK